MYSAITLPKCFIYLCILSRLSKEYQVSKIYTTHVLSVIVLFNNIDRCILENNYEQILLLIKRK